MLESDKTGQKSLLSCLDTKSYGIYIYNIPKVYKEQMHIYYWR